MNHKLSRLSQRYQAALRQYVKRGLERRSPRRGAADPALRAGRVLGRQALAAGLHTLDLARIHEQALVDLNLANSQNGMLKRSQNFFAWAIAAIEETHLAALAAKARLVSLNHTLGRRTTELAATNLELKEEVARRRAIEQTLRDGKRHYAQLLTEAHSLQDHLRRLSRKILSAQEEERKRISRELHDVIMQTLTAINVQLAKLKTDAAANTESLEKNISATQQLVEKSVSIVHQFARELRPTVLDDLGLIPALHTFMKDFREKTGLRVSLTAFAAVEHLNGEKRTVLYRVAQEALTNVARHARASSATVKIEKLIDHVRLKIKDNGAGFHVERVLHARKNTRLGLLGMRERVEMVGGTLTVKSILGKGTTINAQIPLANNNAGGGGYRTR